MTTSLYNRLAQRFDPGYPTALSRRDMLKATLAASAGLLLSGALTGRAAAATRLPDDPTPPAPGAKRVAVIGAGLAGLACAFELASVGYDVRVIEARKRLGGRVLTFTDFVPGRTVEAGGEFIGANHPAWIAYSARFSIPLSTIPGDENLASPILLNGQRLDDSQAERLYVEMTEVLNSLNADAEGVDADRPWAHPRAAEWDSRTLQDWLDAAKPSDLCRRAVAAQLTANNGVALDRSSYLGMLACVKGGGIARYWTDTEVYRAKGGNARLADSLADAIGRDRILLSTPVVRVTISRGRAAVVTESGDTFNADDVVVTVPPSAWRGIEFFPDLPRQLTPQMGSNVKFLAGVSRRFWKDSRQSGSGLSDGEVQAVWEATEGQEDAPDAPAGGGACLTGFAGGPNSETLRLKPDDIRQRDALMAMQGLYPDLTKENIKARFLDWPSDRWAGGSYSFPAPGQVTALGPLYDQPRGKPALLHLAGEWACLKFVGYMEGALTSGIGVARRIAARDGLLPALPTTPAADHPADAAPTPAAP